MKQIGNGRKYYHNGTYCRTSEDLTQMLFEEIDFKELSEPTSFFRSDFRGSRFLNVQFYKNEFDRADFISCSFQGCTFNSCNISASEIKNCSFSDTLFCDNTYNHTSIQDCIFNKCEFPSEKFLVNMKNCEFIDCKFVGVSFERSTTEKLLFENCELINTDFATMHAERHQFENCNLVDVSIGLGFFFGYLFSNTTIDKIEFLYHGEVVHLDRGKTLNQYLEKLQTQGRYYEYLNAHIQFAKFELVPSILKHILEEITHLDIFKRQEELKNLLNMYSFYTMNNVLPYKELAQSIQILKEFPQSNISFKEHLDFQAGLKRIDVIFEKTYLNTDFIESANREVAFITFKCKTDDYNEAYKSVSDYLTMIFSFYGMDKTCNFELVKKEKGSWWLTFAMIASSALLTIKFIKECTDLTVSLFEAHERITLSSQRKKLYKTQKLTFSSLQKATRLSREAGVFLELQPKEKDSTNDMIGKMIELVKLNS